MSKRAHRALLDREMVTQNSWSFVHSMVTPQGSDYLMTERKRVVIALVPAVDRGGVHRTRRHNARNSAALNCLRVTQCAGLTLLDPSSFSPAFLFCAIATLSRLTSQRHNFVLCTVQELSPFGTLYCMDLRKLYSPTPN
ncbi:hypothetical protein EVAR_87303_1 [Eumeta japonica]|uniref:Uncharacterized protein n=1 Tax=Eumeta variegata TaxID=151549 RepID=A0A4C1VVZ4_EUMVA|nr:hypothetical protein EVAR_87303_1 [Eumeta japonica]